MIRDYRAADIDQILEIWLSASVKAHNFIEPEFWKSMIGMMRDVYIPASETLVYEKEGEVVGFYSLYENNLGKLRISPIQGSEMSLLPPQRRKFNTFNPF